MFGLVHAGRRLTYSIVCLFTGACLLVNLFTLFSDLQLVGKMLTPHNYYHLCPGEKEKGVAVEMDFCSI